jgi:hypothetical protein
MRRKASAQRRLTRPADRLDHFVQKPVWVALEGSRHPDELHHVEASLPQLHLGNPGVGNVQLLREGALAEIGLVAGRPQQREQPLVGGRMDRLLDDRSDSRSGGGSLPKRERAMAGPGKRGSSVPVGRSCAFARAGAHARLGGHRAAGALLPTPRHNLVERSSTPEDGAASRLTGVDGNGNVDKRLFRRWIGCSRGARALVRESTRQV